MAGVYRRHSCTFSWPVDLGNFGVFRKNTGFSGWFGVSGLGGWVYLVGRFRENYFLIFYFIFEKF